MTEIVERMNKKQSRGILREALLLIPNFLKLLFRLFRDQRVPLAEKAFLTGAIVYIISPLDLIPDLVPFVGQVDDLYLVALTMLRLLVRTPDTVINEHWDGGGDLAGTVAKIARAAQYVLPKRIQQVLLGRVEIAPRGFKGVGGGLLSSPAEQVELEERRAGKK